MAEIIIKDNLFHLRNDEVSYIIGILEGGIPAHLYFGKRLEGFNPAAVLRRYELNTEGKWSPHNSALDHTPHEFPSHGLGDLRAGFHRSWHGERDRRGRSGAYPRVVGAGGNHPGLQRGV